MEVVGTIVFVFFLAVGLLATVLGLPGTLVIAVDVFVYGALTGFERTPWWLIVLLFVCSAAAETIDNVLSGLGVKRYEGSNRAVAGAIVGGLIGAIAGGSLAGILGTALGPAGTVAGFLAGPIVGGMALSYVGALLAERTTGKEWPEATRAATGAFLGRVLAIAFKVVVAAIMVLITLVTFFSKG